MKKENLKNFATIPHTDLLQSGFEEFELAPSDSICFSILITGKCNINCSYCHYYAKNKRSSVNFNLSKENFRIYLNAIKYIQENVHSNIQIRFSGGEPIMAGELMFEYSNIIYAETGIKPSVLSNGKAIDSKLIEKSINNNIGAYLISIENPFNMDKGSVDTDLILEKISKLNSEQLPLLAAVIVLSNDQFFNLAAICDYCYESTGQIPSFLTLNFKYLQNPSEEQLNSLKNNLKMVLKKYFGKEELNLFHYVAPELATGFNPIYLVEFDLDNSLNLNGKELELDKLKIQDYLNKAYFPFDCPFQDCDWHSNCQRVKWVWRNNIKGYCDLKKVISKSYFENLVKEKN